MSQYESPYYSGGGGGGFLQSGSQPSPGGGQRSEAAMSVRPITAAQFLKATQSHGDGPWFLETYEIGHVTTVGQVISIQQQTTNHTYFIDDGTGCIEAKHWVGSVANAEAEMEKWKGIEEGTYVRLSGFMKSFSNKKYINASYMRPIEDFNEIYFHLLECITVTLTLERGPPYGSGGGERKGTSGSSAYQLGSNVMDTRDEYSDLPAFQQQIVRFILAENNREGVHVGLIARAIGKDADAEQISAALDALLDSGILYNTIDDSHFTVSRFAEFDYEHLSFHPRPMVDPESPYYKADGKRSTNFGNGLRHVTIRQILRATHVSTKFEIENQETGFVALIANVYDVNHKGGKLEFGLDDGTGRIKAYMWDLEGIDAECELAEHQLQNFSYVRAIGKVSEYRSIYSIHLQGVRFVEDPHEIYQHLLRVMVESLILRRGPPGRDVLQSMPQIQQPSEVLSMQSLRRDLPNLTHTNTTQRVPSPAPQTQPPLEHVQKTAEHISGASLIYSKRSLERIPHFQSLHVDEPPVRRNCRIGGDSPTMEAIGLPDNSSLMRPEQYTTNEALPPKRPPRSPDRPVTAAASNIQFQQTLYPDIADTGRGDGSSSLPKDVTMGSALAPTAPPAKPLQSLKISNESAFCRRDPYSHLTSLQRDIILTIQNALSTAAEVEKGVALTMLVKTIARRRPQITDREFQDAFDFLIDEGYIYNTIDDNHYSCT